VTGVRSYLGRYQPVSHMSDEDIRRAAHKAWHDRGMVCITAHDLARIPEMTRATIISEASRLYGRRANT
jgi:hypothetical protein